MTRSAFSGIQFGYRASPFADHGICPGKSLGVGLSLPWCASLSIAPASTASPAFDSFPISEEQGMLATVSCACNLIILDCIREKSPDFPGLPRLLADGESRCAWFPGCPQLLFLPLIVKALAGHKISSRITLSSPRVQREHVNLRSRHLSHQILSLIFLRYLVTGARKPPYHSRK